MTSMHNPYHRISDEALVDAVKEVSDALGCSVSSFYYDDYRRCINILRQNHDQLPSSSVVRKWMGSWPAVLSAANLGPAQKEGVEQLDFPAFEAVARQLFEGSNSGTWAVAHQTEHPRLKFGMQYKSKDGVEQLVKVFTHSKTMAYGAEGKHLLVGLGGKKRLDVSLQEVQECALYNANYSFAAGQFMSATDSLTR